MGSFLYNMGRELIFRAKLVKYGPDRAPFGKCDKAAVFQG